MAINRTSLSAQSITENTEVALELLSSPPDTSEYLATPVTPGILVGFYNDATDTVELYLTDATGRRYIKVR